MIRFLLLILLLVFVAEPAAAMPAVGVAVSAAFASVGISVTAAAVNAFLIRTLVSVGLSLLAQKLNKPKAPAASGVKIDGTTAGEDVAMRFPVGRRMVGGHLEYHNSHGSAGGTPNAYYTMVISVSDVPGVALRRLRVNDEFVTLGDTPHGDFGFPILQKRAGGTDHGWIKFYDGNQTAADPMLVNRYGGDPDQSWGSEHILSGVAYAIVTMRFNREIWQGPPVLRFELDGIPLYDPRADSSVGGSGSQRWNNPATWAPTENPAVIAYNLMRGIPLPGGNIYGGEVAAADLPLSNAVAGMNVCDTIVNGRPQFRAGLEISVDEEPAAYIEELLKAGLGQVSELGGVFRTRWGAPDEAVMAITDDDISVSNPQEFDPFPGIEATYNAIRITHPNVETAWEPAQTPALFNAVWEAEDGGRRLPVQMNVAACFDHGQAQQLQSAYIRDERRFRQHQIVLPPEAQILEPLDTIAWTSARNGYSNKLFEVVASRYMPKTMMVALTIRERDPSDYDWDSELELPSAPGYDPTERDPRSVADADWSVTGTSVVDANNIARRPALLIQWDAEVIEDARQLEYQVEVNATGVPVTSGLANGNSVAVVVVEGILPAEVYRARVRPVLSAPAIWSDWKTATTPDVRLTADDIAADIIQQITDAEIVANQAGEDAAAALEKALSVEETSESALVLRPIGGTGAANIRIVEWDDETGAGSAIVLSGDNVIAPGTLSTSRLVITDLSGNLVQNGQFLYGDLRGWDTSPAGWAVVAFDAGSSITAINSMPSPHAISMPTAGVDQTMLSVDPIAVRPGDRLSYQYQLCASGAGASISVRMVFRWYDQAGNFISETSAGPNNDTDTFWTSWLNAFAVAPSGAAFAFIGVRRLAGGSGIAYMTNLVAERQRNASILITPNSITGAQLITTQAIITASAQLADAVISNAKIGNLQVDNAKIANLTVGTGKIQNGAVTNTGAASGSLTSTSGFFQDIAAFGFSGNAGAPLIIGARAVLINNATATFAQTRLLLNETIVLQESFNDTPVNRVDTFLRVVNSAAGWNTVRLQGAENGGGSVTFGGDVYATELKK